MTYSFDRFFLILGVVLTLAGCDGGSCPYLAGEVRVRVQDSIDDSPIPVEPTFTVDGSPMTASCADTVDAGQTPCGVYLLHDDRLVGAHTLVVGAPGYHASTLPFDTGEGHGSCGSLGADHEVYVTASLSRTQ